MEKLTYFQSITDNRIELIDDSITYAQLEKYIDLLDKDKSIDTMCNLFSYNTEIIRKKGYVKVAFLVYSSSEWQCENLYRIMDRDDRYEPTIVICGYSHGTDETIEDTYVKTCEYFRNARSYRVVYMGCKDRWHPVFDLNDYDILFYCITYRNAMLPSNLNMEKQNISKLIIHIPYSFYLVKPADEKFKHSPIIKMAWRNFASSELEKNFLSKEERLEEYNIFASGMSKIDDLRNKNINVRSDIWKGKGKYRIIWAPHFNMKMNGTFFENYNFFYEYAKSFDDVSWIVRPHPRMEIGIIEYGLFDSIQKYRDYMNKWNALPNAAVFSTGDYLDIFATSDAIIHDSISFLAEYMYTGKPQLQLLPKTPREMNIAGVKLSEAVYTARGNNYKAIEAFINNVVKNKDDPLKIYREIFVSKYLTNDADKMGITSADYIFKNINDGIFNTRSRVKVFTVGVFDFFHLGHLRLFKQAKMYGDYLIVAVQKESHIRKYKPDAKLLYSENERIEIIESMGMVDDVITYEDVDRIVKQVDFDIFAVGEDQDHDGFMRAINWCLDNNKQIVRLERTPGISSREIKRIY